MRAAVIGAGFAGLVAADELQRAGAEVVVLEARDRVGGRVWSRQLDNGAVVEMGAEFLLPGNTAIRDLAGRLGLGLWDKGMRYGRREPRGGIGVTEQELDDAVQAAGRALAVTPPELSASRFLDELDAAPGAREALLARVEISSANTADTVAARDIGGIAHIDDDPAPSIAGGNQGIALKLAEGLDVRLGSPVERIAWRSDGVRLSAAGAELEADACVVAVPATRARPDRVRACAPRRADGRVRVRPLRRRRQAVRAAAHPGRAERGDGGRRALLDLDGNGRRRRAAAGGQRLRRLGAGAGAARGRQGATALARLARAAAARAGAGRRRRAAVDLGRRPLGRAPPTRPHRRRSWPSSASGRSARWPSRASTWAAPSRR